MGPCPALARPNVAQILGADTHEQSSCCLTVPLPFRLVCGRLPDMVCSNGSPYGDSSPGAGAVHPIKSTYYRTATLTAALPQSADIKSRPSRSVVSPGGLRILQAITLQTSVDTWF